MKCSGRNSGKIMVPLSAYMLAWREVSVSESQITLLFSVGLCRTRWDGCLPVSDSQLTFLFGIGL